MYKIILAVELECSINRTPSPPKRWALSGHWLKGGNVGFKKLLLVLESAELANEEQENDCVVGLFVEERCRPGRLSVVGTLENFLPRFAGRPPFHQWDDRSSSSRRQPC